MCVNKKLNEKQLWKKKIQEQRIEEREREIPITDQVAIRPL